MNRIKEIKTYNNNLIILSDRNDRYSMYELSFDGQQGEYTRQDWINEDLTMYNPEEQKEILDELERTSNVDFFIEGNIK